MSMATASAPTSSEALFAAAMLGAWPDQAGNALMSPWSAREALTMTCLGARGITRDEMAAVLHLTPGSDAASSPRPAHSDVQSGFTLLTANSVWIERTVPVLASFLAAVKTRHRTEIRGADFQGNTEQARAIINAWVSGKTRALIRELQKLGTVTEDTGLVLVNAQYLYGQWLHRFGPHCSLRAPFHNRDGSLPSVTLMSLSEDLLHHDAGAYSAVFLPYRGSDFGMAILLPAPNESQEFLTTSRGVHALFESLLRMQARKVHVELPRFKARHAGSLKGVLMTLGMRAAFSELADFTAMVQPKDKVKIGDVIQECVVNVGEEGTEAEAATAVIMDRLICPPPAERPVEFRVDRPFLFAITDREAHRVLFLGRVCGL